MEDIGYIMGVHKSTISRWIEEVEKTIQIRRECKCGKDNISRYLKRDYDIKIHSSTIRRYLKKLPPGKDPKFWDKNKIKIT